MAARFKTRSDFSLDSLRHQKGWTIRADPSDKATIAWWARRWNCSLSKATMRLAMSAATGQEQFERVETLTQWLVDGLDYFNALAHATQKWQLTDDDAHRLMVGAMGALSDEEGTPDQRVAHATRVNALERLGSFARVAEVCRAGNGLRALIHHRHSMLTDVVTAFEVPPAVSVPPWKRKPGGMDRSRAQIY